MQIAVHPAGELESRAASALLSDPDVDRLGLIGKSPPASWGERAVRVEDALGFEVVVGAGGLALARQAGAVLVVPGPAPDAGATVTYASPVGLARALSHRLGAGASAASTYRSPAVESGESIAFPLPVGWAQVAEETEGVKRAPLNSGVGAAAARSGDRSLAVVDDADFLASACLAAGAVLAVEAMAGPVPVWEHSEEYLMACQQMGLVVAEAFSAGPR